MRYLLAKLVIPVAVVLTVTLGFLIPKATADGPIDWNKIHGQIIGCPSGPWQASQHDGFIKLTGYWEWRGSTYLTKHFQHNWVDPNFKVVKQTRDTEVCESFKVRLKYYTEETPKYVKLKIFEQNGDWLETSQWRVR